MDRGSVLRNGVFIVIAAAMGVGAAYCQAPGGAVSAKASPPDAGLYLKVVLADRVRLSKLKPGEVVEGSLARDVYAADRELFNAGSPVRLTVDHMEKRKRTPNDHWPGVIKLFTPRHENYPVFKTADVTQASGESRLQVSLISVSRLREVHAAARKSKSNASSSADHGAVEVKQPYIKKAATPTMVFEAFLLENAGSGGRSEPPPSSAEPSPAGLAIIPADTRCHILLLGDVSASKSKPGDVVRARLLEPVLLNSRVVLPAGSVFEGRVVRRTPPRWLSRAGSLYLSFTQLTLPEGTGLPITASVAGAELDRRSHTRIDSEGQLHGERPGKAWMAINLGVTAGLAKEADDTVQVIVEAIVSTATDASTAGTARIVASCVSGLYMVTRRGRDVVLPRFTEMDLSLDRPVTVGASSHDAPAGAAAGGK
ncbi:MAG TPA: hypothetical protein VMG31_05390 [Verrucomicrobiae bacterium]|nr:hypothetical protein [Verrucomicrobiae bacterium]